MGAPQCMRSVTVTSQTPSPSGCWLWSWPKVQLTDVAALATGSVALIPSNMGPVASKAPTRLVMLLINFGLRLAVPTRLTQRNLSEIYADIVQVGALARDE